MLIGCLDRVLEFAGPGVVLDLFIGCGGRGGSGRADDFVLVHAFDILELIPDGVFHSILYSAPDIILADTVSIRRVHLVYLSLIAVITVADRVQDPVDRGTDLLDRFLCGIDLVLRRIRLLFRRFPGSGGILLCLFSGILQSLCFVLQSASGLFSLLSRIDHVLRLVRGIGDLFPGGLCFFNKILRVRGTVSGMSGCFFGMLCRRTRSLCRRFDPASQGIDLTGERTDSLRDL